MKDILIAGLGNTLMSDEGIGVALVRELQRRFGKHEDVEFADLGSSGMRALHAMAGRRKAVFIDCALMDAEPGAIRRFTPQQARSRKDTPGFSLHEGDLLSIIETGRRVGECAGEVVIFGIQPQRVTPGEELSSALRERFDEYLETIAAELD